MASVGQRVFFRHPKHSWILGNISDINSEGKTETFTCKVADPLRKEAQPDETPKVPKTEVLVLHGEDVDEEVDDLLQLSFLHDATLLRCLYIRYMKDLAYTNIGAIVVALNPFSYNIERYKDDKMEKYLAEGKVIKHNVPHSWAQAHNTYNEMIDTNVNQCILISGESGAGKTEATKIVMKYLARVSSLNADAAARNAGLLVGSRLASCSPFLEAFGNAKTVRNDNSSRFGKFMKVKFSTDGWLVGAHTTKYLLEKSRIITAAQDERVYHAFYMLVRGRLKRSFGLDDETAYDSIKSGGCLHNNEYDTDTDFDEVCEAMKKVGLTDDDITSVWKIPAGVLSLLNVRFTTAVDPNTGIEAADIDPSRERFLEHAAKVLSIDENTLRFELLNKTTTFKDNTVTKPNTKTAAIDTRDAMCKACYDGVFSWLVDKCNTLCDANVPGTWIGLLDIFGFENFVRNSFEQLCINLANEQLQTHYNDFIFKKDMEECRHEGINTADIECPDNRPCLRMICGQGGIIPLLDEECTLEQGSEKSFYEKVVDTFKDNVFFDRQKSSQSVFAIKHYAGKVSYETEGWLDKNRDTLKDSVKLLMRASKDKVVAVVLPEPIPLELRKGKGLTVGGFFVSQLSALTALITSTNPHWIRCIKPNPEKKPRRFDGVLTNSQLESSGVLGTVKIRKAGYPVRIPHPKFLARYNFISEPPKNDIKELLSHAKIEALSQIGTTKVFMKSEAYSTIEKLREVALLRWVARIQRFARGYQGRKIAFGKFLDKHRDRILREKKEREERLRIERERIEAERRAIAEKARLEREAEMRRRQEEQIKQQKEREDATTVLQKYIRGGLTRITVFRKAVERERAKFERTRERQMYDERRTVAQIDELRRRAERDFTVWLNSEDELHRFKEQEEARREDKKEQKTRILTRELSRAEEKTRFEIITDETMTRQTIVTRCAMMAKHKQTQAAARAAESVRRSKSSPKQSSPLSRTSRKADAAMNDARTDQLLADFALTRAKAYEAYFPDQPQPVPNTFANRAKAFGRHELTGSPAPTGAVRKPLFEQSKKRWERYEEWTDSHAALLSRAAGIQLQDLHHDPVPANVPEPYAGPFRTPQAAAKDFEKRSAELAMPAAKSPVPGGRAYSAPQFAAHTPTNVHHGSNRPATTYEEPPWVRAQPQHEPRHATATDWESTFNERLW